MVVRNGTLLDLWRRITYWAIPGVLLAALAWSLIPHGGGGSAPSPAPPPETPGAPHGPAPSGEIRAGTFVGTDDAGHTRWQISADNVLLAQGRKAVLLRNVRATFFDQGGAPMIVTGDRGRYNTETRDVDIEGNVHGVSRNGRELFADTLHYAPAGQIVTGTGHIRVVEARLIMYADQVVSDITLDQTKFFGRIHMTLR